jgi:hypothetical protein
VTTNAETVKIRTLTVLLVQIQIDLQHLIVDVMMDGSMIILLHAKNVSILAKLVQGINKIV